MANYVILDTSIYRELGLKFYDNIDYKNLCNFTIHTDGEVLLSNIVIEEFCGFYKSTLKQKVSTLTRANRDLFRDPFFEIIALNENDIELELELALNKFRETLRMAPHYLTTLRPTSISGVKLTKFILESKETQNSNIQVRDYLIWDSVLNFAKQQCEDRDEFLGKRKIKPENSLVTFITKDQIFENNKLFLELKQSYKVNNIEIRNSISDFLEKKGFYFDFITTNLILQKITFKRVLKNLNTDIGALLSYVSNRYHDNCYEKEVIESAIENIEIIEHYTYLDSKDGKYKFIAHLKVWVNVVFEKDEIGYKESLLLKEHSSIYSLETYDDKQRPYFKKPILFLYGGQVDIETKSIKTTKFIDFIPDMYT